MVITKEVLQALNDNINVTWQKRFKDAQFADLWKKIAMPVNSKNSSEKYAFLGAVPGMREFKSERAPGSLSGYSYEIDNKKFESTIDVDRDLIEDDNTGQIMLWVTGLSAKAAKHYTRLVTAAFQNATSTTIYDGQNFFDADHPLGSNYLGSSKDITDANVKAARLQMAGQKDDKDEPLGYVPTALIYGPYNASAAEELVNKQFLTNGESNPNYHKYELIELPHLPVSCKLWALADLSEGILPFIMQIRVAITLVAKTDLNSDRAFDKDIFTWGTRGRHNAGYGDHQLIVGATAS